MGLCKCRVVTNLFCFQHKQSVCDKCIVTDHSKCVIKSYLQWLQDSDFDPNCPYCKRPMEDQDTIRLTCLDVFHKSCVEKYASSLPEHTAPAGFTCMACSAPIIPQANEEKPIAQELRKYLSTQSWAQPPKAIPEVNYALPSIESEETPQSSNQKRKGKERKGKEGKEKEEENMPLNRTSSSAAQSSQPSIPGVSSRKGTGVSAIDVDVEEDKYKQRSGPFSRMFWSTFGDIDPKTGKRVINKVKLVIAIVLLLSFLFFFSYFSSIPSDERTGVVSEPN